jgi:hypothetical protein
MPDSAFDQFGNVIAVEHPFRCGLLPDLMIGLIAGQADLRQRRVIVRRHNVLGGSYLCACLQTNAAIDKCGNPFSPASSVASDSETG